MMMPHPCPPSSRLLKPFFNSHNFFIMEKWPVSVQSKFNSKIHKVKLLKFQNFNFDLKFLWNWSFFIMKKLWDLKKVFSNLELEGQQFGIIMGVTRLLLLGPFYTLLTKQAKHFEGECTRSWQKLQVSFFLRSSWNQIDLLNNY